MHVNELKWQSPPRPAVNGAAGTARTETLMKVRDAAGGGFGELGHYTRLLDTL